MAAAARAAERGARVAMIDEGSRLADRSGAPSLVHTPPALARRWLDRLAASGADGARRRRRSSTCTRDDGRVRRRCERGGGPLRDRRAATRSSPRARASDSCRFPAGRCRTSLGIGGAQALLKTGTSFRGKRVVIAGSGPLLLPVAASLAEAGAELVARRRAGAGDARGAVSRRRSGDRRRCSCRRRGCALAFLGDAVRDGNVGDVGERRLDAFESVTVTDGAHDARHRVRRRVRGVRARAEHRAGAACSAARSTARRRVASTTARRRRSRRVLRRRADRHRRRRAVARRGRDRRASPRRGRRSPRSTVARAERRCSGMRGASTRVCAARRAAHAGRSRTRSCVAARTCDCGDLDPAWTARQASCTRAPAWARARAESAARR